MNKLLPRRWQKQPQTPVEIDWSHPLAKGLTGLWIFNSALPVNLVNGYRANGNRGTYRATQNGKGFGNADTILAPDTSALINGINGTILYYGVGEETSGSAVNFLYSVGSTSFGINGNASNQIGSLWNGSAVYTTLQRSGNKKIVITSNSTSRKLFNNGRFVQSIAAGGATAPAAPLYLTYTNAFKAVSSCNAIATWNRALSDKEAAEASKNIYQLLKPPKQLQLQTSLYISEQLFDLDLPLSAPTFDAEMSIVEENQILFDLDLTTSAPDLSAGFLKGELLPLDLPAPSPDIFLDIGQVTRFSMALPMPSVGINMAMDTGILIPISLPLPVPEIESDLIAGQLINLNLDLPVFDISLGFGEGFAFDVPAPRFEADIRVGNVVSFGLDMPTPNLAIELATERALNIEMPMPAFNLEMAFITGNVVEFALDMPAPPFSATVLSGLSMDIALDTSIPDLQAQFGLDGYIDFAFTIPAPMLQADFSSNITSATGRFFNRWTR